MTGQVPCLDTGRVKISNIGKIFPQTLLSPSLRLIYSSPLPCPHHLIPASVWPLMTWTIQCSMWTIRENTAAIISHEPASIICPLCGAARISKSLLSSHASASPRSRRPLASPVSLLWRMKGDNCVNWCYSEMFCYSVLSSHHSNHHEGGMVIIESRWRPTRREQSTVQWLL